VLGAKLFKATKRLRIARLADALDDDAQMAEADPSRLRNFPRLRQAAISEIIDGIGPSREPLQADSEWVQAVKIVKTRWRQFSAFENYELTPEQRRRIRHVFEHVDGVGADIAKAARKKAPQAARLLAKKLRAAAGALDAADADLLAAAGLRAGYQRDEPISMLRKVAGALEDEANLQVALRDWHGHVETRGRKNMQRSQAIDLLVPIFEEVTGKKAHASWDPFRENRETLFVRFVTDMFKKAGHEAWCRGLVDAVRLTLKKRKRRREKMSATAISRL
jgi:hypothetical protein